MAYYQDFIKPNKAFRAPTEQEKAGFSPIDKLKSVDPNTSGEDLQSFWSTQQGWSRGKEANCAIGSGRFIRSCWGRIRGRAVPPSRFMGGGVIKLLEDGASGNLSP